MKRKFKTADQVLDEAESAIHRMFERKPRPRTAGDNPKWPPLILSLEEMEAINWLLRDRLAVLEPLLHPRERKSIVARVKRLRNIQKKLWQI